MAKKKSTDRKTHYSIGFSSFHHVAYLPFVQNKWISLEVWIDLMKGHIYNTDDVIRQLSKSDFKRAMTPTNFNMTSSSLQIENFNGYYYQRTNKKVRGISQQHVDVILVTKPGALPRLSQRISWH